MSARNPSTLTSHAGEKLYRTPPVAATRCPETRCPKLVLRGGAGLAPGVPVRHFDWSGWTSTMDATTLDRWVPFRSEGTVVRCRLFCFPHAAGNAALYRPLRSFMPAEIDLCPVELPGRAARLGEPPFTSMSALMERLHHALQPLMAVPFGFFGHSVGACVAFEAAR